MKGGLNKMDLLLRIGGLILLAVLTALKTFWYIIPAWPYFLTAVCLQLVVHVLSVLRGVYTVEAFNASRFWLTKWYKGTAITEEVVMTESFKHEKRPYLRPVQKFFNFFFKIAQYVSLLAFFGAAVSENAHIIAVLVDVWVLWLVWELLTVRIQDT